MRVRFIFADQEFTATLFGNPTARDFFTRLSLDLTIEDYCRIGKITGLPHPLSERGALPFSGERVGDVCYFAPRNSVFFRTTYQYSAGLIRIGKIYGGCEPLQKRGSYQLSCTIVG